MIDFFDNFYDDFYDEFYFSGELVPAARFVITFSPGEGTTGGLVGTTTTGGLVVSQASGLPSLPVGTGFLVLSSGEYLVNSDGNYLIANT